MKSPLRKPVPGRLFVWVKRLSWIELAIFTGLLVFWIAPGFATETMVVGRARVHLSLPGDLGGVHQARGALPAARRDPHTGRAGRECDRDRTDRAQRVGGRRSPRAGCGTEVIRPELLDRRRLTRYR